MSLSHQTPSAERARPAPQEAPKGSTQKSGKTSNQDAQAKSKAQAAPPPPLPTLGDAGPSVVLASGAEATAAGAFTQAAIVEGRADLWRLPSPAGSVRLAQESSGAAVVELVWPAAWGAKPVTSPVPSGLQPLDARMAVQVATTSAGWGSLDSAKKGPVEALLAGETNQLSGAAQRHFRGQVSADFPQKDAAGQASALGGLLTDKAAMPGVVAEPVTAQAVPYTRTGPTEEKGHAFRGQSADAQVYTLRFEGDAGGPAQEIRVFVPSALDPQKSYHTVTQVEEAVARLPLASRKRVVDVTINPGFNPEDAFWAATYNDPSFHAYMTAGQDGHITIYPSGPGALPSQDYMNGTIIHETGHTWSFQQWGTDKTKGGWVKWREAMASDQASPSGYATNDIAEDVAETVQLYGSTKGKPAFEEYRRVMPARFSILDTELK